MKSPMADSTRDNFRLMKIIFIGFTFLAPYLRLISGGQCFGQNDEIVKSTTTDKLVLPDHLPYQEYEYERQMDFALDMFHQLNKKDEKANLFFSPYSIQQTLLLAFFGSSGSTEKQLRKALSLPNKSKNDLLRSFKMESYYQEARQAKFLSTAPKYQFKLANRLFFSKEEPIRPCVQEIFDKEIEQLDFFNETESSRMKINNWVEKNTNGRIKEIIPNGYITTETRVALANSAYFKGFWEIPFKKSNTKLSLFYISSNEFSHTMMMHQKGSYRHGVSESLLSYIIELPYEGEALSMFILLPPFAPNALDETISRLNSTTLREAMTQMHHDSIEVAIPKFKIEQTLDLRKALQTVGIVDLFDEKLANLTEFSTKEGLALGTARHKSYLEVNEEGAEAAAATVLIDTRSGRPFDQTRFVCNRPFVYFIYDNALNNILFIGAFKTPKIDKN